MDYCYIILFQGDFTMAKEVTVYTMNRCPFCLQLKLFLKRQGVEFTEINTSEHPEVLKMLQDETSFLKLQIGNVREAEKSGFAPDEFLFF